MHGGGKRLRHEFRALYDFYGKRIDYGEGEFPSCWPTDMAQASGQIYHRMTEDGFYVLHPLFSRPVNYDNSEIGGYPEGLFCVLSLQTPAHVCLEMKFPLTTGGRGVR